MMLLKKFEQEEAQNPKEVVNGKEEVWNAFSKENDKIAKLANITVKIEKKNSHKTIQTLEPGSTTTFCSEKLMNGLECKG